MKETQERLEEEIQARASVEQETESYAQKLTQATTMAESEVKERLKAERKVEVEVKERTEAEHRAEREAKARSKVEERLNAEIRKGQEIRIPHDSEPQKPPQTTHAPDDEAEIIEDADVSRGHVECECCGKGNLDEGQLVRIDSGQMFCPECLDELKSASS